MNIDLPPAQPDRRLHVLLVDDDTELALMVVEMLRREGMQAAHVETGSQGLAEVARAQPDVLVLDVMLPDANGLDLCRRLRAQRCHVPILMLTGRGDPQDRVLGLEIGADDYLGKPFEPRELVARVRALARRSEMNAPPTRDLTLLQTGALRIDLLARRVTHADESLALTAIEFKLLVAFVAQPGMLLTRELLSAAVQPGNYVPLDRAVDVQVARLRKKLRVALGGADWIQTLRGEGYMFRPCKR
jgi:DNA-binding response OmpR family regulator